MDNNKNKTISFPRYRINGIILIGLLALIIILARPIFLAQHDIEPIVQGPGVTRVVKLSNYFNGLEGIPGDTDVYILEGKVLEKYTVLGGTHPTEQERDNDVLIENVQVKQGS